MTLFKTKDKEMALGFSTKTPEHHETQTSL
jgi:hypothetical protein